MFAELEGSGFEVLYERSYTVFAPHMPGERLRSGVPWNEDAADVRRFPVKNGKTPSSGKGFASFIAAIFDGFRVHRAVRIWCSACVEVRFLAADRTLNDKINSLEIVEKSTFGGANRNRLFVWGARSIYAASLRPNGLAMD